MQWISLAKCWLNWLYGSNVSVLKKRTYNFKGCGSGPGASCASILAPSRVAVSRNKVATCIASVRDRFSDKNKHFPPVQANVTTKDPSNRHPWKYGQRNLTLEKESAPQLLVNSLLAWKINNLHWWYTLPTQISSGKYTKFRKNTQNSGILF